MDDITYGKFFAQGTSAGNLYQFRERTHSYVDGMRKFQHFSDFISELWIHLEDD